MNADITKRLTEMQQECINDRQGVTQVECRTTPMQSTTAPTSNGQIQNIFRGVVGTVSALALTACNTMGDLGGYMPQAQYHQPMDLGGPRKGDPWQCTQYFQKAQLASYGTRQVDRGTSKVAGDLLGAAIDVTIGGKTTKQVGRELGNTARYGTRDVMTGTGQINQEQQQLSVLQQQCADARQMAAQGECRTTVNQRSSAPVVNGQIVGDARGTYNQYQYCQQQTVQGSGMPNMMVGGRGNDSYTATPQGGYTAPQGNTVAPQITCPNDYRVVIMGGQPVCSK